MAQVAAGDQRALGVGGQPVAGAAQQLVDLVGPDPVVLVVVEHRQQHEQVLQQVAEPHGAGERDVEVAAVAPLGERRVERDASRPRPRSRAARTAGAAAPRRRGPAPPAARRRAGSASPPARAARWLRPPSAEPSSLPDRDRQERRGGVGPVVDVLGEGAGVALGALAVADEPDGVDLDEERGRAPLVARLAGRRGGRRRTAGPCRAPGRGSCGAGTRGRSPAGAWSRS